MAALVEGHTQTLVESLANAATPIELSAFPNILKPTSSITSLSVPARVVNLALTYELTILINIRTHTRPEQLLSLHVKQQR
jgi:hypothetical protein